MIREGVRVGPGGIEMKDLRTSRAGKVATAVQCTALLYTALPDESEGNRGGEHRGRWSSGEWASGCRTVGGI